MSKLYCWLWYHLEFWLPPLERRPFTYILRDIYHDHPIFVLWFLFSIGFWIGKWFMDWRAFFPFTMGLLLGHLFWSGKYHPGQQEDPPYIHKR